MGTGHPIGDVVSGMGGRPGDGGPWSPRDTLGTKGHGGDGGTGDSWGSRVSLGVQGPPPGVGDTAALTLRPLSPQSMTSRSPATASSAASTRWAPPGTPTWRGGGPGGARHPKTPLPAELGAPVGCPRPWGARVPLGRPCPLGRPWLWDDHGGVHGSVVALGYRFLGGSYGSGVPMGWLWGYLWGVHAHGVPMPPGTPPSCRPWGAHGVLVAMEDPWL